MFPTGQVVQDGAFGVLIAVTGLGQLGQLIPRQSSPLF